MFKNDFITQVHACGMMSSLKDSRDISVHGLADEEILDQGLQQHEIVRYKDLWVMQHNPQVLVSHYFMLL